MAEESNVFVIERCNQRCLFCSQQRIHAKMCAPDVIRRTILSQKGTISLEGGEPTLSRDLAAWVRLARDNGAKDIILCTNGTGLQNTLFIKKLLNAGVTLFNINLPSHIERVFDALTGTRGLFRMRVEAVKNALRVAGKNRVRLTYVINKLNYATMTRYARFVKREFPGLFYIELNLIKVLGHVISRRFLVPRLTELEGPLNATAKYCLANGIKFISDGIPLCYMKGFESMSIDAYKLHVGKSSFLDEKARQKPCRKCSLAKICAGPRADYVKVHGYGDLRPSKKSPAPIIREIEAQILEQRRGPGGRPPRRRRRA